MTEIHSEKQIMTYDDKEIDETVAWLRRFDRVEGKSKLAADMLTQLKIDRAFLRTELRELTEPISDAGHTTADGLRHEIAQLRERNTDLMAKWGIATGRALAAGNERDKLRAALERRGEAIFGKEGD